MKKRMMIPLLLAITMALGACSTGGISWPKGPAARDIPVCGVGKMMNVTERPNSDFIMIILLPDEKR